MRAIVQGLQQRHLLRRIVVALTLLVATRALGDGGAVQVRQADGPFVVTIFTAPTPLRAGPVDISVLVQTRDGNQPVLDAQVFVTLKSSTGDPPAIETAATRQQATNKLLFATVVNLPFAGPWDLRVTVRRGQEAAEVSCEVAVAAALPPLLSHWPYLAFPPVAVLIFTLHQWVRSRSSKAS